MKIKESYTLTGFSIEYGCRKLEIHSMPSYWYVSYWYDGIEIKRKEIGILQFFKLCDKYRGKKTKGYNRPVMTFLEFDTKEQ